MQMRAVGFALQSKSESAHIARFKSFNFIQLNLNFLKNWNVTGWRHSRFVGHATPAVELMDLKMASLTAHRLAGWLMLTLAASAAGVDPPLHPQREADHWGTYLQWTSISQSTKSKFKLINICENLKNNKWSVTIGSVRNGRLSSDQRCWCHLPRNVNGNACHVTGGVDLWTKTDKGCACPWNVKNKSCACCTPGGCHCGERVPKRCGQCGIEHQCDTSELSINWCRHNPRLHSHSHAIGRPFIHSLFHLLSQIQFF